MNVLDESELIKRFKMIGFNADKLNMAKSLLNNFLSVSRGAVCITLLWGTFAFASNELAQTFTLDGQLMIAGTTTVLSDSAAVLKIDILDPTKTCVLYEEQQTVVTAAVFKLNGVAVVAQLGLLFMEQLKASILDMVLPELNLNLG